MKFAEKRIYSNPGSRVRPVYKLMYSGKTNALELERVGEEDFQEYIESFAAGCDINVIIEKIKHGDVSQLNASPGIFGDFSDMPQSLAEFMQVRLDAEANYNSLPDSVRSKFDSFEDYMGSAGSKDWFEKLGVRFEEEVKVGEKKDEQE